MLISWEKPKQVRPKAKLDSLNPEHPGDYQPNMSEEDNLTWKGKVIGHQSGDPRVEIRKLTDGGHHESDGMKERYQGFQQPTRWKPAVAGIAQLLMVVWPDGSVRFSANGKFEAKIDVLCEVVTEAQQYLANFLAKQEQKELDKQQDLHLKWSRVWRYDHNDFMYQAVFNNTWVIEVMKKSNVSGWYWRICRRGKCFPVQSHSELGAELSLNDAKMEAEQSLRALMKKDSQQ